jgi:hypothetical protein
MELKKWIIESLFNNIPIIEQCNIILQGRESSPSVDQIIRHISAFSVCAFYEIKF